MITYVLLAYIVLMGGAISVIYAIAAVTWLSDRIKGSPKMIAAPGEQRMHTMHWLGALGAFVTVHCWGLHVLIGALVGIMVVGVLYEAWNPTDRRPVARGAAGRPAATGARPAAHPRPH